MERCLECDGLLTKNESVCPICGKSVRHGKRPIAEFLAGAGRVIFFVSIAGVIVSRFTPGGFGFILSLCLCACALFFIARTSRR
ncbi:MAG TPA: hypothetical protein VL285_01715 [Bryobacteraceae bacterium]|nr:hypothetical protein [Bryobacteraceae bacterium]